MLENRYERDGDNAGRGEKKGTPDGGDRPLADREVPLSSAVTADVINRWLDGDEAEPVGLRGEAARSVDFWRRVGEETNRRREVVTPAHVLSSIMEALPPDLHVNVPWYKKPLQVSPMTMLAAAAGLMGLGAWLSALVRLP